MEKDVVKYLKLKGKSERFISLILKILQDNNITENEGIILLKKSKAM